MAHIWNHAPGAVLYAGSGDTPVHACAYAVVLIFNPQTLKLFPKALKRVECLDDVLNSLRMLDWQLKSGGFSPNAISQNY